MNLIALVWAGLVVLASVQAEDGSQMQMQTEQIEVGSPESQTASQEQGPIETPEPTIKYIDFSKLTQAPSATVPRNVTKDPGPWVTKTIGHDEVKPFPQPEPVTISEKAGVKFKPQIQIRTGCVPYPAVNELGETSGGLQTSGSPRGGCRGSGHGSQVYGRSTWIEGVWAIMYSWYFPKDSPSSRMGHRHDWEHAIVFIDNPEVAEPKILACSVSSHDGYKKYSPCPPWVIDGTSLKVRYKHAWPLNHDLDTTGDAGTFQDLIMWDQMSNDARRALNSVHFGKANTPFNDGNFRPKLEKAWPFKK
ncbi:NPP1 protein [Phytophthora nicotianae]|uniref:NPP1 protein n=1 Tax=Phytophthora nicotianae TaxID=4792 RepID=A0A0W8D9Z5_PHYNI|nr:NPP1 protein [Phytophthora nicotianae]